MARDDDLEGSLATVVRGCLERLFADAGFDALVPREVLRAGLEDLELGLGQLLADVERASRRGIPLNVAVHDHEAFPYLGRFHGLFHDAYLQELPAELVPLMRRIVRMPTPSWTSELLDALCIVVRSDTARVEERAFARLLMFEGIRVNLFMSAYRTGGRFEGVGGCRRDLDDVAAGVLAKLLARPLQTDDSDMSFAVVVAAAIATLEERVEALREAQRFVEELRAACEQRAQLELLLRQADPVDAAIMRNHFDRAPHQQPIPVARLPLEHPLILGGYNMATLNTRSHRAIKKLKKNRSAIARRPRPITMADLIIELENENA